MREKGASIEEMARAISIERNRIRLESYKDDPQGLKSVKESNLKTYGMKKGRPRINCMIYLDPGLRLFRVLSVQTWGWTPAVDYTMSIIGSIENLDMRNNRVNSPVGNPLL